MQKAIDLHYFLCSVIISKFKGRLCVGEMEKRSLFGFNKYKILLCLLFASLQTIAGNKNGSHHLNSTQLSEREVTVKFVYKIVVDGHLNSMRLKMVLPDDIKDRQTIESIEYSTEPDSTYKINSNNYVLFKFYDIEKSFKITIKCKLVIYNNIKSKNDSTNFNLSRYLEPERFIESESPQIIALAATLKQKTDIETVMKTFEYVKENIHYELKEAIGAEQVLSSHVGKCMDFSDLFVALLRANKIPAKSEFGMDVDSYDSNPLHAWPEAYLKKQGWVRFDPTTGHSSIEHDGKNYIMKIDNKYITLSEGRNEPELRMRQYQYSYFCTRGSTVSVKASYDIAALE
ncbi:MAG TPA: hypothetical protein DCQ50_21090 [Chryseobacterium sp.]|nr:hypothetical protein [Chryseobacterium sp.]